MNQQPDKLFRDKLDGYQRQPSSAAWDRIEAGVATKNKPFIWMRVAAALLVLAVAAFLLWPGGSADTTPETTAKKTNAPDSLQQKHEVKTIPADENAQPLIADKKHNNDRKAPRPESGRTIVRRAPETKTTEALRESTEIKSLPVVEADELSQLPEVAVVEQDQAPQIVKTAETSVTLVITADEVNDKYLDKEALAEATSRKKNASTFKKLLTKAYDLKNNQDPFGDLRQKKNEILALNFKNDKQRGQNK